MFKTQGEVLEYLHGLGLKISRAKLSKDYRAGILLSQPDKTFLERDVVAYAESLKAPDYRPETDAESPEGRQLRQLKAMVLDFCTAAPDMNSLADVVAKWLEKNGNDPEIAQKLAACQRRITRRIRDNDAAKHCEDSTQKEQSQETLEHENSCKTKSGMGVNIVYFVISAGYFGQPYLIRRQPVTPPAIFHTQLSCHRCLCWFAG